MKDNYVCSTIGCEYFTNAQAGTTPEELDIIVERDGGFMKDKKSCCPKCKEDSLVYLYS